MKKKFIFIISLRRTKNYKCKNEIVKKKVETMN